MKKLFYVIITACSLFAAAALCMVACKKDDNGGNGSADGNYWTIHNTVAKGIKSVEMDNYAYYFDKDGREIGSKSSYGESSITYNSDGFPTRIESKDIQDGKVTSTEVQTFEYGNKGKWTPVPMGPGNVFHIYMQGLYNGISKVTWTGGYNDGAVMEYKFNGNKLTVTTTSPDAERGDFEDIVFEYDGAYPTHYKRAPVGTGEFGEEIGPLTYQANGMFDQYKENFLTDGIVYQETIINVSKKFKNVMQAESEVRKSYNLNFNDDGKAVSQRELYRTSTNTYTYNEQGDVVSETNKNLPADDMSEDYLYTYEYEYDAKGNWTKCTTTMTVTRPANASEPRVYTQERKIQYY